MREFKISRHVTPSYAHKRATITVAATVVKVSIGERWAERGSRWYRGERERERYLLVGDVILEETIPRVGISSATSGRSIIVS